MGRIVPLVLCALLLASAAPAFAGHGQYQKLDALGNPVGPITDFDPDAKHEVSWIAVLICGGITAFVAYEYYRQEAVGIYVLEGSERGINQWIARTEHPLFFWFYIALHAALAAYCWWLCLREAA
jgi:hypothetical protein